MLECSTAAVSLHYARLYRFFALFLFFYRARTNGSAEAEVKLRKPFGGIHQYTRASWT